MTSKTAMVETLSSIVIENISPEVDSGTYLAKTSIGENFIVRANIFKDGHDVLRAILKYRSKNSRAWKQVEMKNLGNDLWEASFIPEKLGIFLYTIEAWYDPIASWKEFIMKKSIAKMDIEGDSLEGVELLRELKKKIRAKETSANVQELIDSLLSSLTDHNKIIEILNSDKFIEISSNNLLKRMVSKYEKTLELFVDRERALFSSWYELFPRSCASEHGKHGTLKDCIDRLSYIKELGFDVIYLTPIHPIGKTNRKGPNNSLIADENSLGSPWAIGSSEGGHKAIHPNLGTIEDFKLLVNEAKKLDMEIALDFAIQCSPDHPYVKDHPEWFYSLPDGTIRFAENPPKKYEDIYPLNFSEQSLWKEIKSVFEFWIDKGVKIFRVDNPHTKPLSFWAWILPELKSKNPDIIFLAEAFTRPNVMKYLAKIGFTQSYTYFTWRNSKEELRDYLLEISQGQMSDYFRPNFFTNTPDILHEYLQTGGRPAFISRLVLAATLSSNYGIYSGYELCENTAREAGSEEYLDSEKYQIKQRNWDQEGNIKNEIKRMNEIRKNNPALHDFKNLIFCHSHNPNILAYLKRNSDNSNLILTIVNLDPHNPQEDSVSVPLHEIGMSYDSAFRVEDLFTGDFYTWSGANNYVRLDPNSNQVHVFKIHK